VLAYYSGSWLVVSFCACRLDMHMCNFSWRMDSKIFRLSLTSSYTVSRLLNFTTCVFSCVRLLASLCRSKESTESSSLFSFAPPVRLVPLSDCGESAFVHETLMTDAFNVCRSLNDDFSTLRVPSAQLEDLGANV
jgi:hypothetical protein